MPLPDPQVVIEAQSDGDDAPETVLAKFEVQCRRGHITFGVESPFIKEFQRSTLFPEVWAGISGKPEAEHDEAWRKFWERRGDVVGDPPMINSSTNLAKQIKGYLAQMGFACRYESYPEGLINRSGDIKWVWVGWMLWFGLDTLQTIEIPNPETRDSLEAYVEIMGKLVKELSSSRTMLLSVTVKGKDLSFVQCRNIDSWLGTWGEDIP